MNGWQISTTHWQTGFCPWVRLLVYTGLVRQTTNDLSGPQHLCVARFWIFSAQVLEGRRWRWVVEILSTQFMQVLNVVDHESCSLSCHDSSKDRSQIGSRSQLICKQLIYLFLIQSDRFSSLSCPYPLCSRAVILFGQSPLTNDTLYRSHFDWLNLSRLSVFMEIIPQQIYVRISLSHSPLEAPSNCRNIMTHYLEFMHFHNYCTYICCVGIAPVFCGVLSYRNAWNSRSG